MSRYNKTNTKIGGTITWSYKINQALQRGDVNGVTQGIRAHWAGAEQASSTKLAAMVIGIKFKNNRSLRPGSPHRARAMSRYVVLKPRLIETGSPSEQWFRHRQNGLHDIGKNLSGCSKGGRLLSTIWASCVRRHEAIKIISPDRRHVCPHHYHGRDESVEAIKAAGLRDQVKIMVEPRLLSLPRK